MGRSDHNLVVVKLTHYPVLPVLDLVVAHKVPFAEENERQGRRIAEVGRTNTTPFCSDHRSAALSNRSLLRMPDPCPWSLVLDPWFLDQPLTLSQRFTTGC